MFLKEKQLNYVPNVAAFIEGKSFIFFLLCPCTTQQWLAYHSLRNPDLDD
jgi:hypothetical protein